MSEETMSPADIMAMMNGNNCNWSNNPFFYLMFMWMFGGGNGFNGFHNGYGNGGFNSPVGQGTITRAEMVDGFNNQNLQGSIKDLQTATSDGFAGVAQSLCSGFGNVNSNINCNSNAITQAINTNTFQNQLNSNNLNNAISGLKYDMAQNCCDLKTAMHSEGEATRGLLVQSTIQDLRDKLGEKDNELQSAQLTLANAAQTQNILSNLGRFVPTGCCGSNW